MACICHTYGMHDEHKSPNHYAKVIGQYSKIHHNVLQGSSDCGKKLYFVGERLFSTLNLINHRSLYLYNGYWKENTPVVRPQRLYHKCHTYSMHGQRKLLDLPPYI